MRVQTSSGLPFFGQVAEWLKASLCKSDFRGFKSHPDLGVISHRSLTVKRQVHTLVDAGANPAGATTFTRRGDSVNGNTPVSKTGILSSNLSPLVHRPIV